MNDSVNLNKYVLYGLGGLFVILLIVVVVLLVQRQSVANRPTTPTALSLPGSTPGRATGYQGAELMPAPPGAASAVPVGANGAPAPVGHATGYQNSNLMPAPPGAATAGAGGAVAPAAPRAPAHATGYQNSNLMPAPPAGR